MNSLYSFRANSLDTFQATVSKYLLDNGIDPDSTIQVHLFNRTELSFSLRPIDSYFFKNLNSALSSIFNKIPTSAEVNFIDIPSKVQFSSNTLISFEYHIPWTGLENKYYLYFSNFNIEFCTEFILPD